MKYEPADLFFGAGEASGDLQGSLLAAAAKGINPALLITAMGGPRLRAAGAKLLYDTTELASIGPLSILPKIPHLFFLLHGLDRAMRRQPSRVFIPIDVGAFNLRLARLLRRGGYVQPIVYYFPPGAWLDNLVQAQAVASLTLPLTPFAHQRDFYKSNGLNIAYFGHPLVSVIPPRAATARGGPASIAVLPGSRSEEVALHLPVLARTAIELERALGVSFYAIAASDTRADQIRGLWKRWGGPESLKIVREDVAPALAGADLVWAASGTAVLEAALVRVPQISFYALTRAQYRIAERRLPKLLLKRVALPNLVLNRTIVPEFLQAEFNVTNLRDQSVALLENEKLRSEQLSGYDELREALGPPDTLYRIAAFVLDQLDSPAAG